MMKKTLLVAAFCALLSLSLLLPLTLMTGAAEATVTVKDGTTLADALDRVADGGTVKIEGTYTIPADFNWTAHGKTVTVTGGVLDFTGFGNNGHFNIRDNVTFTGIELKFATIEWDAENDDSVDAKSNGKFPRTNIYANGYDLTVAADVQFTEGQRHNTNVCLFGGSKGGTVNGDTNLTVLAGWYTYIFGGGHGGTVNGSTHVTVGGNVNATAVISNHDSNYNAYGGGWADNITGSTYLTVQDSARLIYAYGGSHGGGSKVGGTANVTFTGGTLMSIYGAHNSGANTATAGNVLMTGGTVDQIFGASNGAHFGTAAKPVNANVTVLGGTVTRRIYGGCYNEFKSDLNFSIGTGLTYGKWDTTKYQVYGHITVTVSDGCNISYSYSDGITTADKGLYARSRLSTYNGSGALPTADETSTLIFLGSYQSSKLKAQDGTMQTIMSTVATAADEIHTLTYTADGAVITQRCNGQGHDADASANTVASTAHGGTTATVQLNATEVYTGKAIENATVTYGEGWIGEKPTLTYENNVNAGTATVKATCHGATATLSFTIEKAAVAAPADTLFTVTDESIRGKADGSIAGLTAAMEYSTDGVTYQPAAENLSALAAGDYYLRYIADDNHHASAPLVLTVKAGRMLTVTFRAEGSADIVREVAWNETLTDIPAVPARTGYNQVAPYWDTEDFADICADLTVNAVYTPNRYTVTFVIDGLTVKEETVSHGDPFPAAPAIPAKEGHDQKAPHWDADVSGTVTGNATVTAVYTVNVYRITFSAEGSDDVVKEVAWGETLIDIPAVPARVGYNQVTPYWNETDFSNVRRDMTVEAVYTLNKYTITFVIDGETVKEYIVSHGDPFPAAPAIPAKEGHDQKKPYWSSAMENVVSDETVTAIYTVNTYTVTFKAEGKTVKTVKVSWGEALTEVPDIPAKTGYDKVAPVWINGNTVAVFSDIRTNMTVTAKYTINTYTVTFKVEGTEDATRTVTHGSAVTDIPAIPVKRGYDKTPAVWSAALDTVLSDLTVTPVYTKNPAGVVSNPSEDLGEGWQDAVLNDSDRAEMELGESVKVYTEKESHELTDAEQAALDALPEDYTVGEHLIISLFKQIGAGDVVKQDSVNGTLTVVLPIHEKLRAEGRSFKLIAISNGEATETDAVYDAAGHTLTVETADLNTVYAVCYRDAPLAEEPSGGDGGDNTVVIVIAAVLGVVGFGGGVTALLVIKKKKKA